MGFDVDETAYADTGLMAATTYFYRVAAYNGGGESLSNTAAATTDPAPTVHLGGLSGSGTSKKRWTATATIVVHDPAHGAVEGATVSGEWAGGAEGSGTCVTGLSGACSMSKGGLKSADVAFTVTNIDASGGLYDAGANDVAATIVIPRGGYASKRAGEAETPIAFALEQNYPNPFNPTTVIPYALPEAAEVRLRVVTMEGREVGVLVDGYRSAGRYRVVFDASRLSAGVYLVVLDAGSFSAVRRMTLLK